MQLKVNHTTSIVLKAEIGLKQTSYHHAVDAVQIVKQRMDTGLKTSLLEVMVFSGLTCSQSEKGSIWYHQKVFRDYNTFIT